MAKRRRGLSSVKTNNGCNFLHGEIRFQQFPNMSNPGTNKPPTDGALNLFLEYPFQCAQGYSVKLGEKRRFMPRFSSEAFPVLKSYQLSFHMLVRELATLKYGCRSGILSEKKRILKIAAM
jgi:hypothetical protein